MSFLLVVIIVCVSGAPLTEPGPDAVLEVEPGPDVVPGVEPLPEVQEEPGDARSIKITIINCFIKCYPRFLCMAEF